MLQSDLVPARECRVVLERVQRMRCRGLSWLNYSTGLSWNTSGIDWQKFIALQERSLSRYESTGIGPQPEAALSLLMGALRDGVTGGAAVRGPGAANPVAA